MREYCTKYVAIVHDNQPPAIELFTGGARRTTQPMQKKILSVPINRSLSELLFRPTFNCKAPHSRASHTTHHAPHSPRSKRRACQLTVARTREQLDNFEAPRLAAFLDTEGSPSLSGSLLSVLPTSKSYSTLLVLPTPLPFSKFTT